MTSITRPGASAPTTTITYGTDGRVSSVTKDGVTKNYTWSTSGGNDVVAVSGGPSGSGTVTTTPSTGQPGTVTNATSNTVSNTYDANKRLKRTTWPEGNYVEYTYDARGNITQTLFVPKSGSGLANISTSANFDTACTSLAKCNRPNYTIDAKGNRTDYTYDPTHGQVTRVRLPAPASGQPRPQIDYSYTALYAKEKNASGTLVNVLTPQYKLTQITRCATAATCTGTANETKITIAYDTPNLQPTSVTVAAGNGSLSSTTAYAYDNRDNLVSVDGPLPGSGDTEYYFYDATDRRIGSISPDPDGAGGNPRIAQRVSYDSAGRVWKVESGVASGPTLSDLNAMTVLRSLETTFDTNSRKLTQVLKDSGGNKVSLTQFSYDSAGRLQCTAVRMNPAIYGSLPTGACTLGTTGSHGPDRITKLYYDANGRTIRQESGVGTAAVGTDGAMTYTANSKVQTATDGEANRTTYEYDGFDRLAKVRFPVATKGANASSTTDYEQYGYDANSNVTSRRTRANETLSFAYDALDRLTRKVVPERSGLSSTHTRDVYYGYDLMGRPLYARFDSASGDGISFAYDALGRMTSTTQAMNGASRTITSAFNTAGARTSLQFPDGNLVNYNRDELNRLHYAGLNAGGYLFYTPYKADGSLSALYRLVTSTAAWGLSDANTKYYYDPLGRLSTIATDMLGSSNDTSTNFTYNPASQIASLTRTNDAYAWTGHANVDRNYTTNGLNQYTAAGPASFTYDANGNLTSDGSNTYVYDVENRLVSRSGGGTSATLRYDPLGRLYEVSGSASGITRFLYDGDALVGEYNSAGTMLRRYVHGAAEGVDDPLVWFEGAGVAGSARRYLYADERGSIIAVTDGNGNKLAINTYDEYGIPGSGNTGRFQYTGQAWVPELGMYYYKARMYSPTLGRFMQTDPIGYADGMNWYNYVGGDPVNAVDPTGLACEDTPSTTSAADGGGSGGDECKPDDHPPIVVSGKRLTVYVPSGFIGRIRGILVNGPDIYGGNGLRLTVKEKPQKEEDPLAHTTFCGTYTPGGASGAGTSCETMTREEVCKAATEGDQAMAKTSYAAGGVSTLSTFFQKRIPGFNLFTSWVWLSRTALKAQKSTYCKGN